MKKKPYNYRHNTSVSFLLFFVVVIVATRVIRFFVYIYEMRDLGDKSIQFCYDLAWCSMYSGRERDI